MVRLVEQTKQQRTLVYSMITVKPTIKYNTGTKNSH